MVPGPKMNAAATALSLWRAFALIADLHIWQVAVNKFAAIISIVAHEPKSAGSIQGPAESMKNWSM